MAKQRWDPVGEPLSYGGFTVQEEEVPSGKRNRFRLHMKATVFLLEEDDLFDLADVLADMCALIEDRGEEAG